MTTTIDDQLFKRLVLLNQYAILKAVDPDDTDVWQRASEVIERHWPIDELPYFDMLESYARSPFTNADRREMFDALDVHQVLPGRRGQWHDGVWRQGPRHLRWL